MRIKILFITVALLISTGNLFCQKHSFVLGDSVFLLDGKPFQMISAEMHYPRIPREAWRARMKMAKAMGINTIGTYIFWNLHQPQKNYFDFESNNDIVEFVKLAKEEGLWMVLRPSPYVCAEWEFGGYPFWLQNEPGMKVRSTEAKYIEAYRKYINEVGKRLAPYQINHGGNILMVQIENEYGSFGKDRNYLELNRKMFMDAGFDGLLYTCDPPESLEKGHLPGLLPAVNGIDDPVKVKKMINDYHGGKGPYLIAEWYPAWFDWWGAKHHTVPAEKYTGALDAVLGAGISINMYMFHGGTTRGFMNGANYNDHTPYQPQISSYDYDAPVNEAGNATHKFMEFRKVIEKHLPAGQVLPPVPAAKPTITIPTIRFNKNIGLSQLLPTPKLAEYPLTFEELLQPYGYVLYRTSITNKKSGTLKIKDLRDFGIVFINGKKMGTLDRRLAQDSMPISVPKGTVILDILVENMGRINFGKYLLQNKKGITKSVSLAGEELRNWKMYSLPFNEIPSGDIKKGTFSATMPVLKKGSFSLKKVGDTYLDMRQWGKGVVWINGHNLGRYWCIGPQQTVYVPLEWLKTGQNEIVVWELLKPEMQSLSAINYPILDMLKNP